MKKILILMLCVILFCAMPLVASADEETPPESVETEETTPNTEETPPAEEVPEEPAMTLPEKIVNFLTTNYNGTTLIGLIITIVAYTVYGLQQFKNIGGKLGIVNNNMVKVAEDSAKVIDASFVEVKGIAENSIETVHKALGEAKEIMQAISDGNAAALTETLGKAEGIAEVVTTFTKTMETFMERIGDIESDKVATRDALIEATKTMEACKKASLEEGNIVAELLLLANIPNSKKEEIYARHLSAVNAIAEAEKSEVAEDDGKET
jgi:hypothetical protein